MGFGSLLNYRFGRGDDVENSQVAAMAEIDDALELGFFVRAARSPGWTANDEYAIQLDILSDTSDVHSGALAEISAEYAFRPTSRLGLSVGVASTYVTSGFAETYYSAADAGASGFDVYDAGAGFKDVGISLAANYALSNRWTATRTVGVTRLIGDAADSPLVQDAGSETQSFVGLGLTNNFNRIGYGRRRPQRGRRHQLGLLTGHLKSAHQAYTAIRALNAKHQHPIQDRVR